MASIERDPEVAKVRIEKRRNLLQKLHNENIEELNNPALIREEDIPIKKICEDPFCKLAAKQMSPEEKKKMTMLKWISIAACICILIASIIIASLIGSLGNWDMGGK
ncbi:hypothetical protein [Mycoplasmopsis primatum]|uniref:hypothetical protein n=1 Tax=Mycoplasmopsis primatum TaxID=55604 RepID=UPI0004968071|nr:hypothetical protein [Mycoplasmopsis primatum]